MDISNPLAAEVIRGVNNYRLKFAVYPIGAWNMDTVDAIEVSHNLSDTQKVVCMTAIILSDLQLRAWNGVSPVANVTTQLQLKVNTAWFDLSRVTGGEYDNTSFNDGVMNRGWILCIYIE